MAVLLSTHPEPQSVQAFGNWFKFKPGQMKHMQDNLANWIVQYKRDQGFVVLPDSVLGINQDGDYTPVDKKTKEDNDRLINEATMRGRQNILDALKKRIHNLEVSVRSDLEKSGSKADFMSEATDKDVEAYEMLERLKELDKTVETPADRIKKLKEKADGNTNSSNT